MPSEPASCSTSPGICDRILDIDLESRTAHVQPGVILRDLQRRLAPAGLRFGPDPSTHARATFGGMIGNNACGAHTVAYGRTVDNVQSLTVVDGLGRRLSTAAGSGQVPGLNQLIDSRLEVIRRELGTFGRQMSGYSLQHLLPEHGRNLTKAMVGTEGTLGVILDATVNLVPVSPARMLVVLGYADMAAAADAVPALLTHSPLAVEGLDSRLVDVVRRVKGAASVPDLPRGGGWLMVEVGGGSDAEAMASAIRLVRDCDALDSMLFEAGPAANAMWRIREDGAGLAGRTPDNRQAWPGWEDAAVPPAKLGSYLREFETLMNAYGVTGMPYGHFGDGCVHVRIDLPLEAGSNTFRSFIFDAAHLVVNYGGSCSGEHGDGRARSELLPIMYSAQTIELFAGVKALFDPADLLNPGVLVRPHRIDTDLRRPMALPLLANGGFRFAEDDGDFTKAVHRCVGVGKCRADDREAGGFMCPSFLATKDEKDVTRGRARVLQELVNGSMIPDFRSKEVHESLDLCLSCKACASDCPAGVDMARYKSEVLHRSYQGRFRPVSHYSLGWLPRWLSLLDRFPPFVPTAVNAVLGVRRIERLVLRAGGMDPRRRAPRLAPVSFRRSWQRSRSAAESVQDSRDPVVLWTDSFTDRMNPEVARAAADVLAAAGYRVIVPDRGGLLRTDLDHHRPARRCPEATASPDGNLGTLCRAGHSNRRVGAVVHRGVALRPGATCFRATRERPRWRLRRGRWRNSWPAGPATTDAWQPPDLTGLELLIQPHCHHHSVMGFAADQKLLTDSGATVTTLAGCCGLAGNFGMEAGHYDTSVAIAENGLLPALRGRSERSIVLADGFSCRTQIQHLAGATSLTLAQLLAQHLPEPGGCCK